MVSLLRYCKGMPCHVILTAVPWMVLDSFLTSSAAMGFVVPKSASLATTLLSINMLLACGRQTAKEGRKKEEAFPRFFFFNCALDACPLGLGSEACNEHS